MLVPRSALVKVLVGAVFVLMAATVIGLVLLWPERGHIPRPENFGPSPRTEKAEVVAVLAAPCAEGVGGADCLRVSATLRSGPDEGSEVSFTFFAAEGEINVDDDIRVAKNPTPSEGGVQVDPYSFSAFERRPPILWLAALFVGIVLFTGRWQGLRALSGLAASLALVVFFIVPAILEGRSPTAVAFVGALAACSSRSRSPTGSAPRRSPQASGQPSRWPSRSSSPTPSPDSPT
jgi:uncharacterized membrane protein